MNLRRVWCLVATMALAGSAGIGAVAAQTRAVTKPPTRTPPGDAAATAISPFSAGTTAWAHLQTKTAVALLKQAAADPDRRADAELALGDIYYARGWEQEDAFFGWHVEPDIRNAAFDAYRAAAAARPQWSTPHERIGRALLKDEKPADALKEFDTALAIDANDGAALSGRWQALVALGQKDKLAPEIGKAAASSDARQLHAAYRGYQLLGDNGQVDALGTRVLQSAPSSDVAGSVLANRIDAARTARRWADVIADATAFVSKFPLHARTRAVYDALIDGYQATPEAPLAAVEKAIDGRVALVPDAQGYLTGANLLVARKAYDKAIALANAVPAVAAKFKDENHAAYRLDDKANKIEARSRASAADVVGWALFQKKELAAAEEKLAEADRLARSQDPVILFHLGELERAKGRLSTSRDDYLDALTFTAPPPIAESTKKSLTEVYAKLGNDPAEFDAYVAKEIARRRDDRRDSLVNTLENEQAPSLQLTSVEGPVVDVAALRGKVLLLNFFTSW